MSRYDMRVMRVMVETLNEAYPRMDREIKQRHNGGWYGSTASQDCMVSPTKLPVIGNSITVSKLCIYAGF